MQKPKQGYSITVARALQEGTCLSEREMIKYTGKIYNILGEKMFKDGLGESSRFSGCHPAVNIIFYAFAIGITMFSTDPAFLGIATLSAWAYSILLKGARQIRTNLLFLLPIVVIMTVVNGLFTHNGKTVLFFLNDSRITLEAIAYGTASAILLGAVIVWFTSFNVVMSSDKLIYLFGKAAPVLGLTLSMIFRFIPLLKNRFKEIKLGQECMGRHAEKGLFAKTRQLCKEISILISWSLEASIETSDSMEARGYGLRGRTSFHLFKMSPTDYKMLAVIAITGTVSAIGCIEGKTGIYYYPVIRFAEWDALRIITFISFTALLAAPLVLDIAGEKKWQQLKLEI